MTATRPDVLFDGGRPVRTEFAAPAPAVDVLEVVTDTLLCNGVKLENLQTVLDAIEDYASEARRDAAAHAVRDLLSRLDGSPAGECLRWVIVGHENESLRALARRCGVSAPAALKTTRKLRRRLGITEGG